MSYTFDWLFKSNLAFMTFLCGFTEIFSEVYFVQCMIGIFWNFPFAPKL